MTSDGETPSDKTPDATTPGGLTPDVDDLARSMLLLHGPHDDDHHGSGDGESTSWSKTQSFANESAHAAAIRESTSRDRNRYLTSGLAAVDCRFCHVSVSVKKLGAAYTAVQWSTDAQQRCAHFAEIRSSGGSSARTPSCPRLSDSIKHAVAEGCLEEYSSAPSPGDG